jgi:hypothetical protein
LQRLLLLIISYRSYCRRFYASAVHCNARVARELGEISS